MDVQTRLNALECIDRLLDSLDKMIILDDVLPFLTDIQCSDVDIIMSIVGRCFLTRFFHYELDFSLVIVFMPHAV